jgi:hypothetical protein
MHIALSDLPEIVRSTLSSFGYRASDIELRAATSYSPRVSGGKGRRGFVACINVETRKVESREGSYGGSNMFSPQNQVDLDPNIYPIPPNCVVVSGSTGGRTFASALAHPAMLPALLPGNDPELTDNDRAFLYILKGFKSSYRKDEAWRAGVQWPDSDRLGTLASKGLIKVNKAGSVRLTTEGKNAANKGPFRIY